MLVASSLLFFFLTNPSHGLMALPESISKIKKEKSVAKVFSHDDKPKLIYFFEREQETKDSQQAVTAVFKTPDKESRVIVKENILYNDGKLSRYSMDHYQVNETMKVEIKNNKIYFEHTHDDKTDREVEDLEENTILADQIYPFLIQHWEQLMKGETISCRFIVPERAETVGFKFFKEEEKTLNGKPVVIIKMKASSFVIALLAKTILFTIDKSTKTLTAIDGRLPPKVKNGSSWDPLFAKLVF